MCAMTLRLDPRRPIVWRTPHSLQIGVDPVLAVLDDVSEGDARLIDALAVGVPRSGLEMLAELAGVDRRRVDALLVALAGALVGEPVAPAARPIAVVGTGLGAQRIAAVLIDAGYTVTLSTPGAATRTGRTTPRSRPAAVVLVSAHVVDPAEHQRWLRSDVLHVPVVFGEAAVRVGPLVDPGRSACLACVEQHRTLDDPAWPAVAAQLWGTEAAAEVSALATEAAVEVLRLLRSRTLERSIRLDSETGERTTTCWAVSERCGCRGLSDLPHGAGALPTPLSGLSAPASRQESGSAHDQPAPWSPAPPTRARAPFAPA